MAPIQHDPVPEPYIPPPSEGPVKEVLSLPWRAPFQWLMQGASDVTGHWGISVFYGGSFWMMAVVLGQVFRARPEFTMSIASGCLLLGPFLAMGLYDVSRCKAHGLQPSLLQSLTCWRKHIRSMAMLVLVLIVLELLWGRASLIVFAVFFNTGMPSTASVMEAVFNPQNIEFVVAYTVVGGGFAALVFSISVVSIPMILDRDTDAISAAITSLEVVFHNPGVMVVWGVSIAVLTGLALLLPWGCGLLVVGPLLGYSSWYAYSGAVRWPQDGTVG